MRPENAETYVEVEIQDVIEETAGVLTLVLKPEREIIYQPGQFLTFIFPGYDSSQRRSYSLSSTPGIDERPAITLKRVINGEFSRPLVDKIRKGDRLWTTGAAGQFTLPENIKDYEQIVFLAAGIGITPIFSMLKQVLYNMPDLKVVLIYSNSNIESAVFHNELLKWKQKYPDRFSLKFLFSNSPNLGRARLSKWLLPQLLDEEKISDPRKKLFFICGPFAYMRMVQFGLIELGYTEDQIRKEQFDVRRPIRKQQPPDLSPREVLVRTHGREFLISVRYPQMILSAARAIGVDLPYSCENGRCGSCVATCTSGKVWMGNNEVLTEREVESGKILSCVAYPLTDGVVIHY